MTSLFMGFDLLARMRQRLIGTGWTRCQTIFEKLIEEVVATAEQTSTLSNSAYERERSSVLNADQRKELPDTQP
jgi:hypothetical protein